LADFGGNIGLWIGFSVITFVELLELLLELFYLCYFRGKKNEERREKSRGRARMRHHLQYFSRFGNMAAAPGLQLSADRVNPADAAVPAPTATAHEMKEMTASPAPYRGSGGETSVKHHSYVAKTMSRQSQRQQAARIAKQMYERSTTAEDNEDA
jgi:hypothetical protein